MNRFLSIFILILAVAGCKESEPYQFPPVATYDCRYFPLDSGMWREFMVTKIEIDEPIALNRKQVYYLREQLGGIFVDNMGDTLRQIERFRRDSDSGQWNRLNTWVAYVKHDEVIQVEENARYVKMQLPLSQGKTWNGNAYNNTDTVQEYVYRVDSIHCPMEMAGFLFDSVLTVSQKNELTAITKVLYFERYATGVGLVQKQQIDIYSNTFAPQVDITDRITQGTLVYYDLIDFGTR